MRRKVKQCPLKKLAEYDNNSEIHKILIILNETMLLLENNSGCRNISL